MKAVEGLGKIYVHNSIGKLNEAFEAVGIDLPGYAIGDFREHPKEMEHEIVIVPPALLDSNVIKKFQRLQLRSAQVGCKCVGPDVGEVQMPGLQ
jgi:hypothetical protein